MDVVGKKKRRPFFLFHRKEKTLRGESNFDQIQKKKNGLTKLHEPMCLSFLYTSFLLFFLSLYVIEEALACEELVCV